MAGDLIAGLMLSKIVSWYDPGKQDNSKQYRYGVVWFVKEHKEWYEECRISKSRVRRALPG